MHLFILISNIHGLLCYWDSMFFLCFLLLFSHTSLWIYCVESYRRIRQSTVLRGCYRTRDTTPRPGALSITTLSLQRFTAKVICEDWGRERCRKSVGERTGISKIWDMALDESWTRALWVLFLCATLSFSGAYTNYWTIHSSCILIGRRSLLYDSSPWPDWTGPS